MSTSRETPCIKICNGGYNLWVNFSYIKFNSSLWVPVFYWLRINPFLNSLIFLFILIITTCHIHYQHWQPSFHTVSTMLRIKCEFHATNCVASITIILTRSVISTASVTKVKSLRLQYQYANFQRISIKLRRGMKNISVPNSELHLIQYSFQQCYLRRR